MQAGKRPKTAVDSSLESSANIATHSSEYMVMFNVFIFSAIFAFLVICSIASASGPTWIQTSAPTDKSWQSIASDSTGQRLAAVVNSGGIFTSSDFGSSWIQTSAPSRNWKSIASDSTGQHLAAVVDYGGIFTSSDFGSSWLLTSAPTDQNWRSIASDSTGQYLAAVYLSAYFDAAIGPENLILTSSDFGSSWLPTSAPTDQNWQSIASDSTGQLLAAVVNNGGIFTSSDFGSSWIQTSAPTDKSWQSIASDSTGQHLAAVVNYGGIFTSSDFGSSWIQTSVPNDKQWRSIASDSTGQYLAAAAVAGSEGRIVTSSDFGSSWIQTFAPNDKQWRSIASDSTGQYLAVVASYGGIFTLTTFPTALPTPAPTSPSARPTVLPTRPAECKVGFHSATGSEPGCSPCPKGTTNAARGSKRCNLCRDGFYGKDGQAPCTHCRYGFSTYKEVGHSTCVFCSGLEPGCLHKKTHLRT